MRREMVGFGWRRKRSRSVRFRKVQQRRAQGGLSVGE